MKLRDHIRALGLSDAEYGVRIECADETVRRYCLPPCDTAARLPRREKMRAIFIESRGAVTPNDFYDLPELSTLSQERAA